MYRFTLALISLLLILFPGCTIQTKRPIQVEIVNPAPAQAVTLNTATDVVWDKDQRHVQFSSASAMKKPAHKERCHRDHNKNADCIIPSVKRSSVKDKVLAKPAGIKVTVNGQKFLVTKLDLEIKAAKPAESKTLEVSDKVGESLSTNAPKVVLDADGESEENTDPGQLLLAALFLIVSSVLFLCFVSFIVMSIMRLYLFVRKAVRRRRNNNSPSTPPSIIGSAVANVGENPTRSEPTGPMYDHPQQRLCSADTEDGVDNSAAYSREEVLGQPTGSIDGLTIGRIQEGVSGLERSVQQISDRLVALKSNHDRHANNTGYMHRESKRQIKALGAKIDKTFAGVDMLNTNVFDLLALLDCTHDQVHAINDRTLIEAADRRLKRQSS